MAYKDIDDLGWYSAHNGWRVFVRNCAGCHNISGESKKAHKIGPNLGRVWNRKIATSKHYRWFSKGLKKKDHMRWDVDNLN